MTSPIRIGIIDDGVGSRDAAASGDGGAVYKQLELDMQLAVDKVAGEGRLDRAVEFVHAEGIGLPSGTAFAVEQAVATLVGEGVLLIVGPGTGDNAIVATPLADRYETPMINWSASERARSQWMFHLQVGSHEDESILMARYLAAHGLRRVGVVYDRSPIGRRHVEFLAEECELLGVNVSTRVAIHPLETDASAIVGGLRDEGVDGLVYMGLGWAGREVARARAALSWEVPRIMNAAGMRGADPDYARDIDGWAYPDMYSDDNELLAHLRSSLGDDRRRVGGLAFGYDMGQLVAEGIARAPELTRSGIKDGLEHIKLVRAAEGHEGTTLGFGKWERGALKGRYLVLREWRATQSGQL
ncbi:MAG TPA: ABC transporter substrate-binding protein [Acidimicrobiales bacterium]|nr:ABC transporter substrate-binding protein [Acidimicrobiales bacterium]